MVHTPQLYWVDGNLEQCAPLNSASIYLSVLDKSVWKKAFLQHPFCGFLVKKQLLRVWGEEARERKADAVWCFVRAKTLANYYQLFFY